MDEQSVLVEQHLRPPRGLFDGEIMRPRAVVGRIKAQARDSRVHNRALVLATLFHQGAMSRAGLARVTGLTAPTVSALVADLEADGLVADTDSPVEGGRRRGKPSMLVEIQDGARTLVTVDLSPSDVFRGAVTDIRGRVLARAEVALADAYAQEAEQLLRELVSRLMALAPSRVLGIGVAAPGIVDDAGVVRQAAHLRWSDFPMARCLTEWFGVPAYVGNDVNLAALAVLRFGGAWSKNVMVVSIEHGVGAGLVVGGQLVEGEQFAAGEIGHITVEADGGACVCGRRGCLDLLASAGHLRARLERADSSERAAVLAGAGQGLGGVLAPIVSLLNLNEVVLVGPADLVRGPFLQAVKETACARAHSPVSASLEVRSVPDELDLVLLGGACLVQSGELGVF
ncbi:ROK family transcriptional regulator [Kitasatospora herbaricolor]|uniref:ROK family transcriptional regulator n=1 Tax=Kitasatospora herbaricolor TaxID=68217 RepID=A0ABZ1W3S2_9ACTN|nr:ROK family transcriptional regulator [Kitasatospora herbaricolor]